METSDAAQVWLRLGRLNTCLDSYWSAPDAPDGGRRARKLVLSRDREMKGSVAADKMNPRGLLVVVIYEKR